MIIYTTKDRKILNDLRQSGWTFDVESNESASAGRRFRMGISCFTLEDEETVGILCKTIWHT